MQGNWWAYEYPNNAWGGSNAYSDPWGGNNAYGGNNVWNNAWNAPRGSNLVPEPQISNAPAPVEPPANTNELVPKDTNEATNAEEPKWWGADIFDDPYQKWYGMQRPIDLRTLRYFNTLPPHLRAWFSDVVNAAQPFWQDPWQPPVTWMLPAPGY